jgi:ABC-2 type transport system ATP-binding protein
MANLIDVKNISFGYTTDSVINDVSFQVSEGNTVGLLGVNGAGKSTLIWLLCNMLEPKTGDILIIGEKLGMESYHIKAQFGVLPAADPLMEHLTVEEHLFYVGRLYNIDKKLLPERINNLIKIFSLEEFRKKQNRNLSTGTRRKVGILTTLIHSPRLLIWDEPFNGLDPIAAATLKDLIRTLKKNGITLFFTSQIIEPVESVCDQVLILNEKKLLLNESIESLRGQIAAANVNTLEELLVKLAGKPQTEMPDMDWLKAR